jgi:hypothetical protein
VLLRSLRFHQLLRFIFSESEELEERLHALFLTAARQSPGSCQLGDTMEARPKQFRQNLGLRTLPLMSLPRDAITYAVDDPERAIRIAALNGIRILSPLETELELPQYPGFGVPIPVLRPAHPSK